MGIDPTEDPPIKPGQPTEPPQEAPPGRPQPEIPPPIEDPGAPSVPKELPGSMPEELPVRGPAVPPATPATDSASPMAEFQSGRGAPLMSRLARCRRTFEAAEPALNKPQFGRLPGRNKSMLALAGRHNPA